MNRPADLLEQAKAMGATFELTTNGVKVSRRGGPLPSDLLEELRRHKDDIRAQLVNHRYSFEYPDTRQREEEFPGQRHQLVNPDPGQRGACPNHDKEDDKYLQDKPDYRRQ